MHDAKSMKNRLDTRITAIVATLTVLSCFPSWATTWHVSASEGHDDNDGTGWNSAKASIQAAIDCAAEGDLVLVGDGTYRPIDSGGKIMEIRSVNGASKTIIDASPARNNGIARRCATLSERIGSFDETNTVLTGFTLTNAKISEYADSYYYEPDERKLSFGGGSQGGTLNHCVISMNEAYWSGGSYGGVLNNCLVYGNQASFAIGGVGHAKCRNCTITGNTASSQDGYGGVGGGTYINCIIWGNSAHSYPDGRGDMQFCCTSDSAVFGDDLDDGNIYVNPCFVNAANGDFRLQSDSPCIDAGTNEFAVGETDLRGNLRITGAAVDMGAYEQVLPVGIEISGPDTVLPRHAAAFYSALVYSDGTKEYVYAGWSLLSDGFNDTIYCELDWFSSFMADWSMEERTVTITATYGGMTATKTIMIPAIEFTLAIKTGKWEDGIDGLWWSDYGYGSDIGYIVEGESVQFRGCTLYDENGLEWVEPTWTVVSENAGDRIDETGLFTTTASGNERTVTIQASYGGQTEEISLIVLPPLMLEGPDTVWPGEPTQYQCWEVQSGSGTNIVWYPDWSVVSDEQGDSIGYWGAFSAIGTPDQRTVTIQAFYNGNSAAKTVTILAVPDYAAALDCGLKLASGPGHETAWTVVSDADAVGGTCARSGGIGNASSSWIETRIEGRGTLIFRWKVSSQTRLDTLSFWIGGQCERVISGVSDWAEVKIDFNYTEPRTVLWMYSKSLNGVAGEDCGWIDDVRWTPQTPPASLGIALNAENLPWETGGDGQWEPSVDPSSLYDNDGLAVSHPVGETGTSWLGTCVSGCGTLSFWWRVDSGSFAGSTNSAAIGVWGIALVIDGEDAAVLYPFSGGGTSSSTSGGGTSSSYSSTTSQSSSGGQFFSIDVKGEGPHTIRWEFFWDGTGNALAVLDHVSWTGDAPSASLVCVGDVNIPIAWIANAAPDTLSLAGGDYEAAALATAANGRPVWQCYVAGLDPTDPDDDLVADIAMVNGEPKISVGGKGERDGRVYTVEGKPDLSAEWGPTNNFSRFFRLKAGLAE